MKKSPEWVYCGVVHTYFRGSFVLLLIIIYSVDSGADVESDASSILFLSAF